VIPCGFDHFLHTLFVTDVARIDPQAGRTRLCRLNSAFVVEMDVGHDGDGDFGHDFFQCL